MNKLLFLTGLLIFFACSRERPADLIETKNQWMALIHSDLRGWQEKGDFRWEINGDELLLRATNNNTNAWLITEKEYDNFHLQLEFQADEAQSGLAFRFTDQTEVNPEASGYMVALDFNPDQQNTAGSIVNIARAKILDSVSAENWNLLKIEAEGTHLKVYLNDQLVAETNHSRSDKGKIGLKVPSDINKQAAFRDLKIKSLDPVETKEPLIEDLYRTDSSRQWEPLFDGNTLNGWEPMGDGSWVVEEGVVHGYSGTAGGFLASEHTYKNFYLFTEFRIIKEDNSGIFIRKHPDSTSISVEDALECNIYDHNGPAHLYSTGSIATHARAWHGMIDYQDWNNMEIFAHENHLVLYVNGKKSSEAYLPSKFNKPGNICLQGGIKVFSEDQGPSDVYFRGMKIKNFD